ncbi:hypothetical protein HanPSC8_Chr09g0389551 [Helianthus annuus]|nr:hypothetical protein HanPSC8_Chr09g0389551 [Helianthus annuus]
MFWKSGKRCSRTTQPLSRLEKMEKCCLFGCPDGDLMYMASA